MEQDIIKLNYSKGALKMENRQNSTNINWIVGILEKPLTTFINKDILFNFFLHSISKD